LEMRMRMSLVEAMLFCYGNGPDIED